MRSSSRSNVAVEPEQVHRVVSFLDTDQALVDRAIVSGDLDVVGLNVGVIAADVRLEQFDHTLRITVRDEGVGFNPKSVAPDRLGLTGVQERARLFGGSARIVSAPGKGTTVDVELPLSDVLDS